jgi:hypothetical protein
VLKKTSAYTGLVIVTAAGALLTSSPAYALDSLVRGSWSSHHHRSHHRNHNWNGNHHRGRIFIRIYIYNKNNNRAIAVARPEHRRRHRDDFTPSVADSVGTAPVGLTAERTPALADRDTASTTDRTPANTTPANITPADQDSTGSAPSTTTGAPATSGTVTPALDEAATGNVSP